MAGPFASFLPLTNPRANNARPRGKKHEPSPPTPPGPKHECQSAPSSLVEVEMKDTEDEWYSCSSSEGSFSPVKKTKSADHSNSLLTVIPTTPDAGAELLKHMPALFGKDLPPCGLDLQVAYENINLRLRKRWLQNHGYVNVVDTCRSIKSELDRDQRIWPPTQNHSFTKKRRPWRRENVFKRELQWIKYFLREAQAQSPELMTESEILNLSKESPVPLELGLSVSRSDVLKLWNEWNRLKRMPTPAMLDVETGMGLDGLMLNGRVNGEANGSDEVSKVSTDSPSMTAVSTTDSAANGDAQVWSSGGHS